MVNISCVCRDKKNNITHLGAEALIGMEGPVLWTVEEVHEKIKNGTPFSINGTVQIRPHYNSTTGDFEYLATYPDGEPINNLGNLELCSTCPDMN